MAIFHVFPFTQLTFAWYRIVRSILKEVIRMVTLDDLLPIPKNISERICPHRGRFESEDQENTVNAIRDAVELNPYFVEFDIQKYNGGFSSGHPPTMVTGDEGKFENILRVYVEHARHVQKNDQNFKRITFPKIDLKLNGKEDYQEVIDSLVPVLAHPEYEAIPFYLVNIGGVSGEIYASALSYFARRSGKLKQRVRLNVNLEQLGTSDEKMIGQAMTLLGDLIFSVSPEIHTADVGEDLLLFLRRHQIEQLHFWLLGPPSDTNPRVYLNTLRYALAWDKSNNLAVYFDINPRYIAGEAAAAKRAA